MINAWNTDHIKLQIFQEESVFDVVKHTDEDVGV